MAAQIKPFNFHPQYYPASTEVVAHQVYTVVLPKGVFKRGANAWCDMSTERSEMDNADKTCHRVLLEFIMEALKLRIKKIDASDVFEVTEEVAKQKEQDSAQQEEENDEEAETGGKRKKKGGAKPIFKRQTYVPQLEYETEVEGYATTRNRFNIFVEDVFADYDENNLLAMLNSENVAGHRVVIAIEDPAMSLAYHMARLVYVNNRKANKEKEMRNTSNGPVEVSDRDIYYRTHDPLGALKYGYGGVCSLFDLLQLLEDYSGQKMDYRRVTSTSMTVEQMTLVLEKILGCRDGAPNVLGVEIDHQKMVDIGACVKQRAPFVELVRNNTGWFSDRESIFKVKMPVPFCAIQLPISPVYMGNGFFNRFFAYVSLQPLLTRIDGVVTATTLRERLLTRVAVSNLNQAATGSGLSDSQTRAMVNESQFTFVGRTFLPRKIEIQAMLSNPFTGKSKETEFKSEQFKKQLWTEAKNSFSTQQPISDSVRNGLYLMEDLKTLVFDYRQSAFSIGVFGDMISWILISTWDIFKAHAPLPLVHLLIAVVSTMNEAAEMNLHYIMTGPKATSKSFYLRILKALLDWMCDMETSSSAKAHQASIILAQACIAKLFDESSTLLTTAKEKLGPGDRGRAQELQTLLSSAEQHTKRLMQSIDPHTGVAVGFICEKISGVTPITLIAATNDQLMNEPMADRLGKIEMHNIASAEGTMTQDYQGLQPTRADQQNKQKFTQAIQRMSLFCMFYWKCVTMCELLPKVPRELPALYGRILTSIVATYMPTEAMKTARAFERALLVYSNAVIMKTWRNTYGSDVSEFVKHTVNNGTYSVEAEPFDLQKQMEKIIPHIVCPDRDIAIWACFELLNEMVDPKKSTVIANLRWWGCGLPMPLCAHWTQYATEMRAAMKRLNQIPLTDDLLEPEGKTNNKMDHRVFSWSAPPIVYQRASSQYEVNQAAMYAERDKHDVYLQADLERKTKLKHAAYLNDGSHKVSWKHLYCHRHWADHSGIYDPTCKNCNFEAIPMPPMDGLFSKDSEAVSGHLRPAVRNSGKVVVVLREDDGRLNPNYAQVQGIKDVKELVSFYMAQANKQRSSGISVDIFEENVLDLIFKSLCKANMTVPLLPMVNGELTEYKFGLMRSEEYVRTYEIASLPFFREHNKGIYMLTTTEPYSNKYIGDRFIDSIENHHTYKGDVVVPVTTGHSPRHLRTIHIKPKKDVVLTVLNPSYKTDHDKASMRNNTYEVDDQPQFIQINKNEEEFYGEHYAKLYNFDYKKYSREGWLEHIKELYSQKAYLHAANEHASRAVYP